MVSLAKVLRSGGQAMKRAFAVALAAALALGAGGCGVIAPEKRRATEFIWQNSEGSETRNTPALVLTSVLTIAFDGLIANPIRYADDAWSNAGPASSKVATPTALGSTGAAIAKPVAFTLCFVGDEILYCSIPGWGLP
jgi:hypothetical protein